MSLRERLASGGFAVTAEISPPRGASTGPITEKAALLRDWVDAVNVTDNQGSNVRLASWAGSLAAMAAGLEPVMQMTCRDRNRIALQSDLLGASALGIRNVLVMTGDHPKFGDHPEAKPVFDLDSVQLLWTLRAHADDQGVVLSGRTAEPARPTASSARWRTRSRRRPGSGPNGSARRSRPARSSCRPSSSSTPQAFGRWMAQVRDLGLHERCYILAGRRRGQVPAGAGLHAGQGARGAGARRRVPQAARGPGGPDRRRGRAARGRDHPAAAAIDGVAGVHLLVAGNEQAVPGILDGAGVRVDRDGR